MRPTLVMFAMLLGGCATLGPVPATTAVSALPEPAPAGEVQVALVPGYYLSQATVKEPKGASIGQLALTFDPAALLGVPGLVVGVRAVGPSGDVQTEPMLGYRRALGRARRVALLGIAHGTRATGDDQGASYRVTRLGGELAVDIRIGPERRWVEPHAIASLAAQYLSAEGTYCLDADLRYGVDCPDPPARLTDASADGLYPAATAGVSLHVLRRRGHLLHGARLLAVVATGAMPRVEAGAQQDAHPWFALGLGASITLGAP